MSFEIKSRYSERVLYSSDSAQDIKEALLEAIKTGAILIGANLRGANLEDAILRGANLEDAILIGANLRGANLEDAILIGANLRGANLIGANLEDAILIGANLRGANLEDAILIGANLRGANLIGANLEDAILRGANLIGANLRGANLEPIRIDFQSILMSAPNEVQGLRAAVQEGRIDGSTYSGDCACLVGTISNIKGCGINDIPGIRPDSNRPAERFFMMIKPGQNPDNHEPSRIVLSWIDDFEDKAKLIAKVYAGLTITHESGSSITMKQDGDVEIFVSGGSLEIKAGDQDEPED